MRSKFVWKLWFYQRCNFHVVINNLRIKKNSYFMSKLSKEKKLTKIKKNIKIKIFIQPLTTLDDFALIDPLLIVIANICNY